MLLRRSSRDGNPHAATLLAPALLVFAVALLGIRLLPLVLRPLLPATRGTGRIGLFLAARQVVRRPAGLRLAALLAVAVGLATFAIAGEGVAQANQQARARVEVGAAATAPVQFEPLHDPVRATEQADPDGSWAMATASWLPDGGSSVTGQVLAVDSRRLAAVAYSGNTELALQPACQRAAAGQRAAAAGGHRDRGTGQHHRQRAEPGQSTNRADQPARPRPAADQRASRLVAGGQPQLPATVGCAAGCTLAGITWDRPIDTFDVLAGTALVSKIEIQHGGQWQPLDGRVGQARRLAAGHPAG